MLSSPEALARFLNPHSVALVGATERSIWSNAAHGNLVRFGFAGRVHLVNPKGGRIYGRQAAPSCVALGERIDAALLMVPHAALPGAIEDLAQAGAAGAVLLAAGFAETGADGAGHQAALAVRARAAGLRLLGPNCLGFANYTASAPLWTTPLRRPVEDPTVAIVSQSGATAGHISVFAVQQRIGLTHMISTGNEADLDIADAIDFLADDPSARAIALFVETVRRPRAFAGAVLRARAQGKPVVLLKLGASPASAAAARAHTGALVGDDRIFSAVCRQLGLARVHSIEELVTTADLMARVGPVGAGGPALVALSGGICGLAIDTAAGLGFGFPEPAPATRASLAAVLPDYATPSNPLDTTGAAMLTPALAGSATAVLAADPAVSLVSFVFDLPSQPDANAFVSAILDSVERGFVSAGKPALMLSHTLCAVSSEARAAARARTLTYSGAGLQLGLAAIGHILAARRPPSPLADAPPTAVAARLSGGEPAVLAHLQAHGVAIVPGPIARSSAEAVALASAFGGKVALKIVSPQIAHKTECGGVELGLDASETGAAFAAMMARVRSIRPDAVLDGAIVAPMRTGGVELFVGTLRDPQWGPVITVGLGGIFVEVLQDVSLRLLPVREADVLEMLAELRGSALLDGFRDAPAVGRAAVARAVVAIGDAALALGPDLVTLEVNPLWANGTRVEALDALAVWADHAA